MHAIAVPIGAISSGVVERLHDQAPGAFRDALSVLLNHSVHLLEVELGREVADGGQARKLASTEEEEMVLLHIAAESEAQCLEVYARLFELSTEELTVAMSMEVGTPWTRAPEETPQLTTRWVSYTVVVWESGCSPGFWCTAGADIPCLHGTYNPLVDMTNATACQKCPAHATTREMNSTSLSDCVCALGYYDVFSGLAPQSRCRRCPPGVDCTEIGVTLLGLPLRPGYYRLTANSLDVRQCPDAAVCDMDTNSTGGCLRNSGCIGGPAVNSSCGERLRGPFCRLCNESNHFYSEASARNAAQCTPCSELFAGDGFITLVGLIVGVLGALVLAWLIVRYRKTQRLAAALAIIRRVWATYVQPLDLFTKAKILFGFYQIASRLHVVYEVAMPMDVLRMLHLLSEVVSIRMDGMTSVLACMRLDSQCALAADPSSTQRLVWQLLQLPLTLLLLLRLRQRLPISPLTYPLPSGAHTTFDSRPCAVLPSCSSGWSRRPSSSSCSSLRCILTSTAETRGSRPRSGSPWRCRSRRCSSRAAAVDGAASETASPRRRSRRRTSRCSALPYGAAQAIWTTARPSGRHTRRPLRHGGSSPRTHSPSSSSVRDWLSILGPMGVCLLATASPLLTQR